MPTPAFSFIANGRELARARAWHRAGTASDAVRSPLKRLARDLGFVLLQQLGRGR